MMLTIENAFVLKGEDGSVVCAINAEQFELLDNWLGACIYWNPDSGAYKYANRVKAIRAVRQMLGLGLRDAKDFTDLMFERHVEYMEDMMR